MSSSRRAPHLSASADLMDTLAGRSSVTKSLVSRADVVKWLGVL
jgi:hypothetical protein